MSTPQSQPDMSATEELVAYLDGELPEDACRRVERRLATDAEYRRQMSELDQAWTALEELPSTAVGDNFTRTTIDMVAVAAERERATESAASAKELHRQRWLRAIGCVALAAIAFVAVRLLWPSENRELVADLPVIAQLDVLTQVGDIDYLRGLAQIGPDRFAGTSDLLTPASASAAMPNWQTPADRRAWIESLSNGEKAELAAKFERFRRLAPAPAAQDRLRQLAREIEQASDRAQLEQTLATYAKWIARRPPGEQMELRSLNTEDRLHAVKQLLERERRSLWRELPPEDERALQDAILDLVDERQEELRVRGDPELQRRLSGRSAAIVAMGIIERELRNDERRAELQDRLAAHLSPAAQEHLESLSPPERSRQLRWWVRGALQPRYGPQELQRYFEHDLTSDQRELLLSLPRSEMEDRLEQMYVGEQLRLPEFGRGRPGSFGPGRRGPRNRDFNREGPPFERRFEGPDSPRRPPGPPGPPPEGRPERRPWPPPPGDRLPPDLPPPGDGPPPPEEPI